LFCRRRGSFFIESRKFLYSLRMPSAGEFYLQKEPNHSRSLIRLNESASKTEYVGIVMLTREPRAFFIPTKSCARAKYLVGGNRYSYSRSADQNPALDFAGYDRTPNGSGEIGIIDAGKTVRAFVDHFEAEPQKLAPGFFF